jgi:hypothetical protein
VISSCRNLRLAAGGRDTPEGIDVPRALRFSGDQAHSSHDRVRTDRAGADGKLTLPYNGRLHHIGIGRTHARTRVLMLFCDLDVRVINATTGELIRELNLDPSRDYQPTGRPPGPPPRIPRKTTNPDVPIRRSRTRRPRSAARATGWAPANRARMSRGLPMRTTSGVAVAPRRVRT